jgi:EAL domain-containing protein (putative c-di-GMP-specific phosphodiesterase class I)
MLTWDSISKWGRRGSDIGATPPVSPTRDLMLEAVIAHEQVDLLFQPLFDSKTGRAVGVEALARCSVVPSAEALFARANSASLGERLSRLVQRKALRSAAVWEGPLKDLGIAINLLPQDISRAGFEFWLLDEIEAAEIVPERITLEITESALVADRHAVAARLSMLRDAGLKIALDDLGTGYSSLSYLNCFPLDVLKIARELVTEIARPGRGSIVVEGLIRLAHQLGLRVVAEGVESPDELSLLRSWDCDLYQGFLGSVPLSQEELTRFVALTGRS